MKPLSSRPDPGKDAGAGMQDGRTGITVVLAAQKWRAAVPRPDALARRAVAAALRDAGAEGAVTVLLTDDAEVKRLNTGHRDKAKPTNVLSFPSGMPGHLGDIALALGVVRREAREAGRHPADHLAHLLAHGALHLAGHDHLLAGEARRMEQAESRIMRRLGRPNPWKEGRGRPAT
jgi:probable rRNA maturation factor